MATTWEYVDQGMIPGVSSTPSYEEVLNLCWSFLERQARNHAKDALMGRSSHVTPVKPKREGIDRTPGVPNNTVYNPRVTGGSSSSHAHDGGYINVAPVKGKGDGKSRSRSARSEADSKLCREKGWCFSYFKSGTCSKGAQCQYKHTKNNNPEQRNASRSPVSYTHLTLPTKA